MKQGSAEAQTVPKEGRRAGRSRFVLGTGFGQIIFVHLDNIQLPGVSDGLPCDLTHQCRTHAQRVGKNLITGKRLVQAYVYEFTYSPYKYFPTPMRKSVK